ncbi:MAG: hypothetical protein LBP59_11625 [Planctomycetaceae bacterium]|jgi:hypothetical protein|nr:hypothetical protein [Planctomycetaceae bacterium]
MKKIIQFTVLGIALFTLILGIFVYYFGGLGQLWAYINGETFCFVPTSLDLKLCDAGSQKIAVFRMTNFTDKAISIIGEKSGCNCAFVDTIPVKADAGKTVEVKIKIDLPIYESNYEQTIVLLVSEPNRLTMHPVRIIATIKNPLPLPSSNSSPSPKLAPSLPSAKHDTNSDSDIKK